MSKLDLDQNVPKDVIHAHDVPQEPTLLDDVMSVDKRQEQAVLSAGDVLSKEFGAKASCTAYKIQPDGTLLVVYTIAKESTNPTPS